MTFARKQDNGVVKSLGAKKLGEVDFGNDDFFNTFQQPVVDDNIFGNGYGGEKKPSNKLKEVDTFGWGGDTQTNSSSGGN